MSVTKESVLQRAAQYKKTYQEQEEAAKKAAVLQRAQSYKQRYEEQQKQEQTTAGQTGGAAVTQPQQPSAPTAAARPQMGSPLVSQLLQEGGIQRREPQVLTDYGAKTKEEFDLYRAVDEYRKGEGKLTGMEGEVKAVQQQETVLTQEAQQLQTAMEHTEQLYQKYLQTQSDVDAQAYLMAAQQLQEQYSAYQEHWADYEKSAAVYDTYNAALEDLKGKWLNYEEAYAAYQAAHQPAEEKTEKQGFWKTAYDVVGLGAGYFNKGIAATADWAANLLPNIQGTITGDPAEHTFFGTMLKPITDTTGAAKDWVYETTGNIEQRVNREVEGNVAATILANIGAGAVAALPNLILIMMTGGASAATQLPSAAAHSTGFVGLANTLTASAQKMARNPAFRMSMIQSLGTSYENAKTAGATETEAMMAAMLSSTFNAIVEVGGGLETLPGEIADVDLSTAQKAWKWLRAALDEGKEEVVQGVLEQLTNKAIYASEIKWASMTDRNAVINPGRMLEEFGMGTAVGGILGGGQVLVNEIATAPARRGSKTPEPGEPITKPGEPITEQERPVVPEEAITPQNIGEDPEDAADLLQEMERQAGQVPEASTGLQWAGSEPIDTLQNNAEIMEDAALQWAGSTPEIIAERMQSNEQEQQQAKLGQSGNAVRTDSGTPAGKAGRTGGQTPKRARITAAVRNTEEARRVRANVEALGGELTSLRELGLTKGSPERSLVVVRPEAYTPTIEECQEIADSEGLELVPVSGMLRVENDKGKVVTVAAAIENGKIFVQTDSVRHNAVEEVMHEVYHHKVQIDPGLQERVLDRIRQTYSKEETQELFERYYEDYVSLYGDVMTEEELEDAVWQEMLADAYANLQRYSDTFGTAAWSGDVQEEVWDEGTADREKRTGNGARFSVAELEGEEKNYGQGVILDTDIFDGVHIRDWGRVLGDYVYKNLAGQEMTMYDEQGNPETVHIAKRTDRVQKMGARNNHKALDELARYRGDNVKALATIHLSELLATSGNETTTNDKSHGWLDENGWRRRTFYAMTRNGKIYEGTLNIGDGRNGLTMYKISAVHQVDTKKAGTPAAQVPVSNETARSTSRDPVGAEQELSKQETQNESLAETTSAAPGISLQDDGADVNAKFSSAGDRNIANELLEKTEREIISGPHSVPRKVVKGSEDLARLEGMTDKEYAELKEKWKNRRKVKEPERIETAEDAIISKQDFTSTPAMEKLGIKIDGSVTRYRQTEQLRAYEKAAKRAKNMLDKRIKMLKATEQETDLAKLVIKGSITPDMLNQNTVDVDTVLELADYWMAAESFKEDMISQRRAEINAANRIIAEELLADSESYKPQLKMAGLTKLVMNERTPERVVKQIFGQKMGQRIYETYFRPVWVNGAEMYRFENRMLNRVETFEDANGARRKLTELERIFAQRMMEGQAVVDAMQRLDEDSRDRVESAAKNVNNGMEFQEAVDEFNLRDERLQGLVQAYADYMEMVTITEDMDQTILGNAVQTYQQIYNEMYDAINDFLVSHGYNEIGFIKGYAPHFQKREVQQGLFGALKALGVEKEGVTELPAEIAGRTADFKPNMRWNPHMHSRKGSKTDYDIQMGFEQYLHYAAEMFYHTDDVMRIRQAVNWFRGKYSGAAVSEAIEDAKADRFKSVEWKLEFLKNKGLVEPGQELGARTVNAMYEDYLGKLYEQAKPESLRKYSEFVTWLENYANIVAGKQSLADRGLEYGGGRNILNLGGKLMRAFSSANVAGNISSVLNQSAQLPLIQQRLGKYLERAMWDMARGGMRKDNFAERSDFLTDKRGVDKLTETGYEKFISGLFKPAELMDRLVSTLAVRGRYLQALDEGMSMEDALRVADDFGRRVMGSRMKGAKPLGFESKGFISQMLHVFQVEASNTLDYMMLSDMPQAVREVRETKGKTAANRYLAGYIVGYLLNAFLLNRLAEDLYGGTPAPFDMIGWALSFVAGGFGRTDEEFLKTLTDDGLERIIGERPFGTERIDAKEDGVHWAGAVNDLGYNMMGDVPYLRNAMGVFGLGDQTMPTVGINDLFGSVWGAGKTLWDQTWKGQDETGLDWAGAVRSAGEDLLDAAVQIVPGGRQIRKTVQGVDTIARGGKYAGEKLQYPVDRTVWNALKAGLFGPSALEDAAAYYAAERTPLTAAQTERLQTLEKEFGVNRFETYDLYQQFKKINADMTGVEAKNAKRDAIDGLDLSDEQKLEVYMQTVVGDANYADKTREKYRALMDAGVTWGQLTAIENEFALTNLDADEDGEPDMNSVERGIAKRNVIAGLDLSDAQKLEVFDQYFLDRDAKNYETTREEFEAMLAAGLSWEDITAAHNAYAMLNADEDLNATQKATEYAKWADQQGWTSEQIQAVKERYTFWQMIPAEASTYERFTGAGLDVESADQVTQILGSLEPEAGKDTVSVGQKIMAIDGSNLTAAEKTAAIAALQTERVDRFTEAGLSGNAAESMAAALGLAEAKNGEEELNYLNKARIVVNQANNERDAMAALSVVLNEDTYAKVSVASEYTVTAKDWVGYREAWEKEYGDAGVSQERVEDVLDGMKLSNEQKAALWQIANKSWKPKNNPYDVEIGQEIYDELNEE